MNYFIKGHFKKSLFMAENGYVVGLFKVTDTDKVNEEYLNKTVTFTGFFHELNDNDLYIFHGSFLNHPKYGEQFQVESYEIVLPEEKDSIVEFLSSGLFKGIGEAKAKKIVNALGEKTLDIIINNPDNLILIPTITKKQADTLHNTLEEYQASYKIVLKLNELGFTTKDSMIIYNKYHNNTLDIIDKNIYRLYEDINDLSFKKIDSIGIKVMAKDDSRRICAGIIYIFTEVYNNIGHSYLFIKEIYDYLIRALNIRIDKDKFLDCINKMLIDLKLVNIDDRYYLKNMYEDEVLISNTFKHLSSLKKDTYKKIDGYIENYEKDSSIKYNEEQLLAIKKGIENHITIITGGPGTGKTTIIKAIIDLYRDLNKYSYKELIEKVALLAPTGRAAKRLTEATYIPGSTIHRFLKWNKDLDRFQLNERNKSDIEFLIIDEASMVDVTLFANLLKALKSNIKIIIVGDYNQLPSVGPGQVLKDLIESEVLDTIVLKYLYRQDETSNIINLAYDVNSGEVQESLFNEESDLVFYKSQSSDVIKIIEDICKKYKKNNYRDFQILVPIYKTINGIDNINKMAQEIFNPKSKTKNEIKVGDVIYRENDKVLELVNMPDDNIFNGDIGIITEIDNKDIYVDFDDNIVKFTPSNYQNIKHGYAISIHKSQGSEFKTVVIPVVKEYRNMLYRKLFYTGITRAKEKLFIVGDINSLKNASLNNNQDIRRSTIKELLSKVE
ncbi:MAG: ATP-dependent RecD-like DNA helicase [Bacilli bacterium]|nr:ATP-dependent RecD-like DNA helicase [Bacilli bacterium]